MKVLIVESSASYVSMFLNRGHEIVASLAEADLVQFTGGSDVSPSLYDEEVHPYTGHSPRRDEHESDVFKEALELGIPMAGICRGSQFLNVMNGGKMFQHVDGHAIHGTHSVTTDCKRTLDVTSTHHQMIRPSPKGRVLAIANESTFRESMFGESIKRETWPQDDTEVVFYPLTKCICFQPHPEYLTPDHPCQEYYFELLEKHLGVK